MVLLVELVILVLFLFLFVCKPQWPHLQNVTLWGSMQIQDVKGTFLHLISLAHYLHFLAPALLPWSYKRLTSKPSQAFMQELS